MTGSKLHLLNKTKCSSTLFQMPYTFCAFIQALSSICDLHSSTHLTFLKVAYSLSLVVKGSSVVSKRLVVFMPSDLNENYMGV